MNAIVRPAILRLAAGSLCLSVLVGCAGSGGGTVTDACDRACLKDHVDGYVAAMLAHDPSRLPLAADARFTEDTVEKPLGDSALWQHSSAVLPFQPPSCEDMLNQRIPTLAGITWQVEAFMRGMPANTPSGW